MSGSRVILKPEVWRFTEDCWIAALDHITWVDETEFSTWEKALDHALWLGWCARGQ